MNNMKIGLRLGIGFAILLLLMIGSNLSALSQMGKMGNVTDEIVDFRYPQIHLAQQIVHAQNLKARAAASLLSATDAAFITEQVGAMEHNTRAIDTAALALKDMLQSDTARSLFAEVERLRREQLAVYGEFSTLYAADRTVEAVAVLTERGYASIARLDAALQKFVDYETALMADGGKLATSTERQARYLLLLTAALAALFGAAIAWWITCSVTRPIAHAIHAADALSKGDLTISVESRARDETGQLLRAIGNTIAQLRGMIDNIKSGSDSIATASRQIAAGNDSLSHRTEEQAASLEETASSMEQITGAVQNNAENARTAEQHAVTTSEVASKGGEAFRRVVETMDQISQSSSRIVDIIGVIDGIAFQTNLLALNAAVEAARAGDQGRGFAVVASEVRSLAQRSADAAREIKQLIETSAKNVESGVALVKQTGTTMEQIVDSVGRVTTIMKDITHASKEQASGVSEVNIAITQMDQVTQENAALVEEATAATKAMEDQCRQLTDAVAIFRLDARAGAPAAAATSAASSNRPSRPLARFARGAPADVPAVTATVAPAMRPKKAAGSGEDWEEF